MGRGPAPAQRSGEERGKGGEAGGGVGVEKLKIRKTTKFYGKVDRIIFKRLIE